MSLAGYSLSRHLSKAAAITKPEATTWKFDSSLGKWVASGPVPACLAGSFKTSPVNTAAITSVDYPGQYRGQAYNANAGFHFDDASSSDIKVSLPFNAKLSRLSSYVENGDQQYSLFFASPCGLAVKFDHLLRLTDMYQKIVDRLRPRAAVGSLSVPVEPAINAKAGEVIATAIGLPSERDVSLDIGVYDLRRPNQISKNQTWTYYHQVFKSTEWYGVCWFDRLPKSDAARVSDLLAAGPIQKSDYCVALGGKTI